MCKLSRQLFGVTSDGVDVELITLDNGILSCGIITYGAVLQSLRVPDRSGKLRDVVLGYDKIEDYECHSDYMGAVVGRVANRIAQGRFTLNSTTYHLAVNDSPNHLHGGNHGFSHKVWTVQDHTKTKLVLSLTSPDMDEGYPGELHVTVTYELKDACLSMCYQAVSNKDTLCNLTGHSYFNLNGHDAGNILDHVLCIHADQYTPSDKTSIPFGHLDPVSGTPMDFTYPSPIGAHIDDPFTQLINARGYDHNYVLRNWNGSLHPAAHAYSPQSGISMKVETTLPGLHFYTANFLEEGLPGKDSAAYGPRHAFCLETQYFPDSVNQPSFPSVILHPGQPYNHKSVFTFSCEKE